MLVVGDIPLPLSLSSLDGFLFCLMGAPGAAAGGGGEPKKQV